jgi:hypothetical protein
MNVVRSVSWGCRNQLSAIHILQTGAFIPDQQETNCDSPVGKEIHSPVLKPDLCDHHHCTNDVQLIQHPYRKLMSSGPRISLFSGTTQPPVQNTWRFASVPYSYYIVWSLSIGWLAFVSWLCADTSHTSEYGDKNRSRLDSMPDLWFSL